MTLGATDFPVSDFSGVRCTPGTSAAQVALIGVAMGLGGDDDAHIAGDKRGADEPRQQIQKVAVRLIELHGMAVSADRRPVRRRGQGRR